MVFTSFNFLIFFPLLAILYWLTPAKFRYMLLLVASYFFYINIKPVFALLLAGVTLSTYIFTNLMDKTNLESRKQSFMVLNIIIILLPLFFFKYFAAINSSVIEILQNYNLRWPLPEIKLILPVGISFYTFMAIGYTVDVYNEEIESEKNIGILALFVSFFPLILSGPIERAKNMLPQFKTLKVIDYSMVTQGLKLMLWGYFMKLVVADRVGIYVDAVYDNMLHHNGTSLLFASFLYPIQVYADLGGYSLIAIGTAKILGIDVIRNFKRPFFATSMSEFWRRWHISLISWLTDYVYTPLSFAFRRFKVWGIVTALMITFMISGIWHGAAFTFVVWGLIQGAFLSIEALTNKKKAIFEKRHKLEKKAWYIIIGICSTFILFSASLVFGRADTLREALLVYDKIFTDWGSLFINIPGLVYISFGVIILLMKDFLDEYYPDRVLLFNNKSVLVRFSSYLLILFIILYTGVLTETQFIYFKF